MRHYVFFSGFWEGMRNQFVACIFSHHHQPARCRCCWDAVRKGRLLLGTHSTMLESFGVISKLFADLLLRVPQSIRLDFWLRHHKSLLVRVKPKAFTKDRLADMMYLISFGISWKGCLNSQVSRPTTIETFFHVNWVALLLFGDVLHLRGLVVLHRTSHQCHAATTQYFLRQISSRRSCGSFSRSQRRKSGSSENWTFYLIT